MKSLCVVCINYTALEDDEDPSFCIMWQPDTDIHQAAGLPQAPPGLLGPNPAASKANVVAWLDQIVMGAVPTGTDVFDRDGYAQVVPGAYSGLRGDNYALFQNDNLGKTTVITQPATSGYRINSLSQFWFIAL